MIEWVPQGQPGNQHYYLQVLTTLGKRIRKKRPELWENHSWIIMLYLLSSFWPKTER